MIWGDEVDTDTYGVSEIRDGFFDASFLKPSSLSAQDVLEQSEDTLPAGFDKGSPLAAEYFFPGQWHELQSLFRRVTTTRAGIRLFKSFAAFFIAYVMCLVPVVRDWLGRYHYVLVVSVIINHPARAFGAQVDGTILTILGTAVGLGWGTVGLLLSTSTLAAQAGYGGILALFLALFMTSIAWVRSFFIRFYQAVLCAGIAITFTTLAETSNHNIEWAKLRSYAIPWLVGQAIALLVNCLVFPDAGARALATTLHNSFAVLQESFVVPCHRDNRCRRRLAQDFVDLSQAFQDMSLDITITRFRPDDVRDLRNLLQGVIRALLSLETETYLFKDSQADDDTIAVNGTASTSSNADTRPGVIKDLTVLTKDVLSCMTEGLLRCDAALMDLSGCRQYLGPPASVSSDVAPIQIRIKRANAALDIAQSALLDSCDYSASSMQDSDVVQLFVVARHVREVASTIENLMAKVHAMQHISDWPRICLPSYPFRKAVHRTNAQVRHDRGGVAAGSYQITFAEIAQLLDKITSREYKPMPRGDKEPEEVDLRAQDSHAAVDASADDDATPKRKRLRYKTWRILYHLQGFDSKYAFKVCLVTALLSVPGYLDLGWWDEYEAWWAVTMSWIVLHTRVGGNLQDLVTRAFLAILGAIWSGAAYVAGNGNPYVMAVFAAVYMLPMLYRFTQSSHPASNTHLH
ncbi:Protein BRE4 [Tolypocladium capitatum]|uniref:Protein BRE4 n=1 Tax=Tolypocladium capitatum TaxID=45235 RepID=A0A2K3QD42_9HYPO|nr:Protein BRE4 [Tolypocladium capitatum]